ncbi:MAG: hypothetical protein M5U34_31735 [Chloroflexi bacterium]|nr:hypothetical protein [Chloroflexota bacterium]
MAALFAAHIGLVDRGYCFKLESWADVWRLLLPMAISGLIVLLRKQIVWLLYKVVWPLVLKGVVWFVGRRYKAFIAGRG